MRPRWGVLSPCHAVGQPCASLAQMSCGGCLSPTGLPLPQRSWGASAPRLSPPSHIPLGSPVILLVSLYHRSSCGPRAPYPTGIPPPHMPIPLCPRDPQGISALQIPLCLQGPLGFLSPCSSPPALAVSRIMRSLPHVPCGPSTQVPRYC